MQNHSLGAIFLRNGTSDVLEGQSSLQVREWGVRFVSFEDSVGAVKKSKSAKFVEQCRTRGESRVPGPTPESVVMARVVKSGIIRRRMLLLS